MGLIQENSSIEDGSERAEQPASVVVIVAGPLRAWQEACLRQIMDANSSKIIGMVLIQEEQRTRDEPAPLGCVAGIALSKLIKRSSKALKIVGIKTFPGDLPMISGNLLTDTSFKTAAMAFISRLSPCVILILGGCAKEVKSQLSSHARWGTWSFKFGEGHYDCPEAAALEAVLSRSSTLSAWLEMSTPQAEHVLNNGAVRAVHTAPSKTVDQLCFAVSPWVGRTCLDFQSNGLVEGEFSEVDKSYDRIGPVGSSSLRVLFNLFLSFMTSQIQYKLFKQQWNVGVIRAPISAVAGLEGAVPQLEALGKVVWMPEEKGRFFADPFGFETPSGAIRILFELFDWRKRRGVIAARTFADSAFDKIESILVASTHLSYPFVTDFNGSLVYVPEHSAAQDVSAFFIDQAGKVVKKKKLMPRIELLDCTFLEWHGKIWMFAVEDRYAQDSELNLYFSDQMDGDWSAHPMNPIKIDICSARPGGTPFVFEGRLFRPGQDCSSHYGKGLVINEITSLSEKKYRERQMSRVDPPPGSIYGYGLHTLSKVGEVTLIDGARKQPIFFDMGSRPY